MNDLEKLNKAIATTRRVHESIDEGRNVDIVRGAMLEALETIVKLLPQQSMPETVRPSEPVSDVYRFDPALVEHLWRVYQDAPGDVRSGIRAILADLAKAPVELPSADELPAIYWRGQKRAGHESCDNLSGAGIGAVLEYIGAHIAPAIAARDAEIVRQSERIAELEKQLEDLDRERLAAIEDRKRAEARVRAWEARTGETQPRIVEAQSTPVDASGKTPGQVLYEAEVKSEDPSFMNGPWWDKDDSFKRRYERLAQAVLRAFGGEALRRVSVRAAELMGEFDQSITRRDLQTVIDAELAKLGVKE